MQSVNDAKQHAKLMREILLRLGHSLTHSETLEATSQLNGYRDWNTYSAQLTHQSDLLPVPENWFITGDDVNSYEVGCDKAHPFLGIASATIRSTANNKVTDQSMATLMQSIKADTYLGMRLMLSANIKAIDVTGAATIWFRIDSANGGNALAFSNLEKDLKNGAIDGTTDWVARSIMLDVPRDAESIHFGFYLRGKGEAYAANFSIQEVDNHTPATRDTEHLPSQPKNMDFAQRNSEIQM